jgi:hypothetical protein
VAATLPEFQIFADTLEGSKHKDEVALFKLLQNSYIPTLLAKEKVTTPLFLAIFNLTI